jgi:hypothetical protein
LLFLLFNDEVLFKKFFFCLFAVVAAAYLAIVFINHTKNKPRKENTSSNHPFSHALIYSKLSNHVIKNYYNHHNNNINNKIMKKRNCVNLFNFFSFIYQIVVVDVNC